MKINFAKVILLGALTAILAIVIEQVIAAGAQMFFNQEIILSSYKNITWFLFLAALVEESLKYGAIRYVIIEKFGFDKGRLLVSSFLLGLFFGAAEICVIVFGNPEVQKLLLALDRETLMSLASILLLQAATALIMGSFLASQEQKRPIFFTVLIFPVAIHLLYNFLVIQKSAYTNFLVFLVLLISFLMSMAIFVANQRKLD